MFEKGTRVRLVATYNGAPGLPVGSTGTVVDVDRDDAEQPYQVQFDSLDYSLWPYPRVLEPATTEDTTYVFTREQLVDIFTSRGHTALATLITLREDSK